MSGLIFNYLGLVIVVVGLLLLIIFSLLSRRQFAPAKRHLPAFESLSDQVGQAVESGGRIHVSLGPNSLVDEKTAVTVAGLAVLDIAAERSAISDLSPIASTADPTALPAASDTIYRAYQRQDELEKFSPKSPRLVAFDPITLAGGATSIIHDDSVRANMLLGSFGPEVALMAEAGNRRKIPQSIGSDRLEGQAAAYVMADHHLLGEEIFMARAYLTDAPSAQGGLVTQDILRWMIIGLIILGAVLQTLGLLG